MSPSYSIIDLPTSFITQEHHKTIRTALLEAALVGPAVLPCLSALAKPQVGSYESKSKHWLFQGCLVATKDVSNQKQNPPNWQTMQQILQVISSLCLCFKEEFPRSQITGYAISLTSFLPGITFRMILFNSGQRHLKKCQAGSKSTQCPEEHIRRAGHSWDFLQSTNWTPCQMIGKLQSLAKIVATVHSEINEFKIKIINSPCR